MVKSYYLRRLKESLTGGWDEMIEIWRYVEEPEVTISINCICIYAHTGLYNEQLGKRGWKETTFEGS